MDLKTLLSLISKLTSILTVLEQFKNNLEATKLQKVQVREARRLLHSIEEPARLAKKAARAERKLAQALKAKSTEVSE